MKKLLALALLLALMLPACALAIDPPSFTIAAENSSPLVPHWDDIYSCWVYTLEAGESYTMSGASNDGVRLHLNKDSGGSARAITLIMNGVDISSSSGDALAVFSNGVPLNIILDPDKVSRVRSASSPGSSLLISGADVTVSGSGTLSASASGYSCHGLYAENNSTLSVCGGTLSASASGNYSYGLYAADGSTVNVSGGKLTASASNAYGYALYAENNSTVNVSGGELNVSRSGYNTSGMTVNESTVTVSGGTLSASAYGDKSSGMTVALSTVNVSGGTLSASAYGNNSSGMTVTESTVTVSGGGTLSASVSGNSGRGLRFEFNVTANVTGGELSVSTEGMHSTGVFAKHGAELNVTGGSMSVQAPGTGSCGLHLNASLLTVGSKGDFDAYGAESAFQPVSDRLVEVQGEGRDIYGRNGEDEDWAVYTYGKNYAKVLPEYSSPNALPKTGDPSMPGAWACLMLAALMSLAAMKLRRALR